MDGAADCEATHHSCALPHLEKEAALDLIRRRPTCRGVPDLQAWHGHGFVSGVFPWALYIWERLAFSLNGA